MAAIKKPSLDLKITAMRLRCQLSAEDRSRRGRRGVEGFPIGLDRTDLPACRIVDDPAIAGEYASL
jgi:hypothetical protein